MSETNMDFEAVLKHRMTKGEAAEFLYPNQTVDYALPQAWIDKMTDRGFEDPAHHFVMLYPAQGDNNPPMVAPITPAGVRMAAIVATFSA